MKGGFFETLSALDEFNDNEICGIVGLCMCQFRKSFGLKSVVTSFLVTHILKMGFVSRKFFNSSIPSIIFPKTMSNSKCFLLANLKIISLYI